MTKAQSRAHSVLEVLTMTFTGTLGSLAITWACMKTITNVEICSVTIVGLCTIWSLVRGYTVRRYFNQIQAHHE